MVTELQGRRGGEERNYEIKYFPNFSANFIANSCTFRKVTQFEVEVNEALRDVYDTYGGDSSSFLDEIAHFQVVLVIVY